MNSDKTEEKLGAALAAVSVERPIENSIEAGRLRSLQGLGTLCAFAAGAWLGGADAPIKLANADISPTTVSLVMVAGVFLARWSIPALVRGTADVGKDARQAPHLIVWAVLAGCMWAVANTLTIYAIRDVGLSIAFPLWNSNSLLAILWGFLLFHELRSAGWRRWLGVLGGAVVMFGGGVLLALASSAQAPGGKATLGVLAALGAGALWGTMYIPYRKAYLSGMNPLSFVTFFTVGELATMIPLAVSYRGSAGLWGEIASAKAVLFWLVLGGFMWVIGDLFQQYAAKYVGISRGVPLSNTNQLWGLLWGVLVFHELRGAGRTVHAEVIGGSVLMALGAVAIAMSSANREEHASWKDAAEREGTRYGIAKSYVRAGMEGRESGAGPQRRTVVDWAVVTGVTALFVALAMMAAIPRVEINLKWATAISAAMLGLLIGGAMALWRRTRFN
jgi:drug/metabolite transporter (DMT)-like permease